MTPPRRSAGIATCLLVTLGLGVAGCGDESGPSNALPTVAFTAQCTALGCSFTNGSADADGALEAYAWAFGDESTPVTTRDATHTYADPGTFTVTLTVTDDDGDAATATASVNVAAAGGPGGGLAASFSASCVYLACEFTDRSVASPTATFSWTFGDNSEVMTTRDASHVYAGEGEYTVTLIVVDGSKSAVTSQQVSVEPFNLPPQADFIYSCTDLVCAFSDRSSDDGGPVEEYHWSFGDGTVSTEPNPSHTYAGAGPYRVELRVTDAGGASGIASAEFTLPATGWPTAELEINCYYSQCGFRTVPTGSTIVAWHWRFGDGGTSTEERPSYIYFLPGTYTVEVTISDAQGGSTTVTRELTVPFPGPQAAFTAGCHGSTCTFTNESTGPVASAHWEFGDGASSEDWSPTHAYQVTQETTFTVTLEVYDYDIGYSKATAELTVAP